MSWSSSLAHLPPEIRESVRAVVWRWKWRRDKRGQWRQTKAPYNPCRPDERAAVNDPATWGPFITALAVVTTGKADGVGVVLGDGLAGVDLDDCRNPVTGAITAGALAIVYALRSYTEVSPSGSGLKVFVRGTLPPGRRHKGNIEMYDVARYFTVTGRHLAGTPMTIEERTAELATLHVRVFGANTNEQRQAPRGARLAVEPDDGILIQRGQTARNGERFAALWSGDTSGHPSSSEADLALCNWLAFLTQGDASRVDRLFRQSGLMRPKWDERRGGQTYGNCTVGKAIRWRP